MTQGILRCRQENKRRRYECFELSICSFGPNAFLKVPPPRKFSRPSGGARLVVFQMKPAVKNQVHFATPSSTSPGPSSIPMNQPSASPEPLPAEPSMPCPRQYRRQCGKTFQKGSKSTFGEDAEEESRSSRRSSRVIY